METVRLAASTESEDQARFLADALEMLVRYHRTQAPLVKIVARGTVVGVDRAGVVVAPPRLITLPGRSVANLANWPDLTTQKDSVWLSGKMSPLAKQNFQAFGWFVIERTTL